MHSATTRDTTGAGAAPPAADHDGPRLHLGCGTHIVPGWVNIDGSWNARAAKFPGLRTALATLRLIPAEAARVPWTADVLCRDLTSRLPFADGSVSAIYSSHLLEHLYLEEADALLRDCARVLRPGGVIRVVVPDLRAIVQEYLSRPRAPDEEPAADRLNERLLLRTRRRAAHGFPFSLYASKDLHSHKWMYDSDSLRWHLRRAGLAEIAEHPCRESRIADIAAIEQASRVLNGAGVCVEGVKPA